MTKLKEFQAKHGTALRNFLASEAGRATIEMLDEMRMEPVCDSNPHAAHYRLGSLAGYEQCERHLQYISVILPDKQQVEMTYGVHPAQEEK